MVIDGDITSDDQSGIQENIIFYNQGTIQCSIPHCKQLVIDGDITSDDQSGIQENIIFYKQVTIQ
ncbi:MAG: hypothetical protein EBS90_10895 [Betaproteobacteria bacterium]|nr:hypothetical protein [Betaproteobacteria bacterium]